MKNVSESYTRKERPIRVMQFGEGNFLRAFVDYGIDVANEELGFNSNVAVVVPINFHKPAGFDKQNNIYTVVLRGQKDGKPYKENRVVTCIDRVIESYDNYDDTPINKKAKFIIKEIDYKQMKEYKESYYICIKLSI